MLQLDSKLFFTSMVGIKLAIASPYNTNPTFQTTFKYLGGAKIKSKKPGVKTHISDIYTYDPMEKSWKHVGNMLEPRILFSIAIYPDVDKICP